MQFGYTCRELVPFIARSINKAPEDSREQLNRVLAVLASWDGRSVKDVVKDEQFQAGHTIFKDWLPRLIKATFSDEFEGIEEFKSIHNRIFNLFLRCLDGPTATLPVSRNYFDDIRTQQEESLEDIFLQTLLESVGHPQQRFRTNTFSTPW